MSATEHCAHVEVERLDSVERVLRAAVKSLQRQLLKSTEALDGLAAAVRDTLCDEETCGRCRRLRDALPPERGL